MKRATKKIVHIQVIPQLSGVQKVSVDILSNLDASYEKYILFGGDGNIDEELELTLKKNNIKPIFLDSLKRNIGLHDIKCFFDLINIFKEYKFDIIHTNSTKPGAIGRIAAKLSSCPKVIHTLHGIAFHKYERLPKRLFYYFIDFVSSFFGDYLISVNQNYIKYFPFARNLTVIHNALDFPDNNCSNNVKKDNSKILTIGYLARLDHQKDPLTLIKAIEYINHNTKYSGLINLSIAGDGELNQVCKNYVMNNNLSANINFLGWISDKSTFFHEIDIFCLPSIYEAFGLVLLEAGYNCKPVIATNVEGIPEVVIDNYSGFLVEPRDFKGIANRIIYFIENKEKIQQMGFNGNNIVKHKFKFEKMINSYISIYEE